MLVNYKYEKTVDLGISGLKHFLKKYQTELDEYFSLMASEKNNKSSYIRDENALMSLWLDLGRNLSIDPYILFGLLRYCLIELGYLPNKILLESLAVFLNKNKSKHHWLSVKSILIKHIDNTLNTDGIIEHLYLKEKKLQRLSLYQEIPRLQLFLQWYVGSSHSANINFDESMSSNLETWSNGIDIFLPKELALSVDNTTENFRWLYQYLAACEATKLSYGYSVASLTNESMADLWHYLDERDSIFEDNINHLESETSLRCKTDWHKFLLHFRNPQLCKSVFDVFESVRVENYMKNRVPGLVARFNQNWDILAQEEPSLELLPLAQIFVKQLYDLVRFTINNWNLDSLQLIPPLLRIKRKVTHLCQTKTWDILSSLMMTAEVLGLLENDPDMEPALQRNDLTGLFDRASNDENSSKDKALSSINGIDIDPAIYNRDEIELDSERFIYVDEYNSFDDILLNKQVAITEDLSYLCHETTTNFNKNKRYVSNGRDLDITKYHHWYANKKAGKRSSNDLFKARDKHSSKAEVNKTLFLVIDGSSSMFRSPESEIHDETPWDRVTAIVSTLTTDVSNEFDEIKVYIGRDYGRKPVTLFPLDSNLESLKNSLSTYKQTGIAGFRYGPILRYLCLKEIDHSNEVSALFLTDTGSDYLGWGLDEPLLELRSETCEVCEDPVCNKEPSDPDLLMLDENSDAALFLPMGYSIRDIDNAVENSEANYNLKSCDIWYLGEHNISPLLDMHSKGHANLNWYPDPLKDATVIQNYLSMRP